jgi:predicted MPP superfamily phosphohydrolase
MQSITALKIRKRLVTFSLIAFCSFWLTPSFREVGAKYSALWFATFMVLFGSQVFWIGRVLDIAERFIPGKPRRVWLGLAATVLYVFFFFAYNFAPLKMLFFGHIIHASNASFCRTVLDGVFSIWLVGSFAGFVLIAFVWILDCVSRSAIWVFHQIRNTARHAEAHEQMAAALHSSDRRQLLRQVAIAISALPFGAAAYGLLYERLNVEVTRRRIALARLPEAFEGFRIVQLSDFHISSFMTAETIRRCVTLTNHLEPDLIALTGDYLSWDPAAQAEVVEALAGLHASYGVLGSLGNHETITGTEASIAQMFAAKGLRILRQEHALVQVRDESINLIGVDDSDEDLRGLEELVMPDTINILLIHSVYPNDFKRIVEVGIDLTLAGHTHGGQLSLEFFRRGLCLSRLETPYVSGWYEKSGCQLYVNRGIGTTMIPIRLGARPEITILELVRET